MKTVPHQWPERSGGVRKNLSFMRGHVLMRHNAVELFHLRAAVLIQCCSMLTEPGHKLFSLRIFMAAR